MTPEWLKFKKYPHIGKPLKRGKDEGWVLNYVTNSDKIATHKFTPLLHKTIYQRKFRPNKNAPKNIYGKRQRSVQKAKERPIFYASHLDSIIYSYYSHLLTNAYELYVKNKDYSKSAVAYRKLPVNSTSSGNKSNIEFAYDTFSFIEQNKNRKLTMMVADITSFFDNLDHKILHKQWKRILNIRNLPEDHYNVYKSLITKKYVHEIDLFNKFKGKLIVERGEKNNSERKRLRYKSVKQIWNIKNEKVVAYCTKNDFFSDAKHLIRVEKPCSHQHKRCRNKCNRKGIPQGTPISATLANIYMLDFDEHLYNGALSHNAFYQRYSDDLIVICDQKDEDYFQSLIRESVEELVKLEIQPQKTNVYRYEFSEGKYAGGIVDDENSISKSKQLEYLGFEYDGSKVRVKTVGFSRFYRSMKRTIRRGVHFATKPENKYHELFENRLYKRFTYKGAKKRLIYRPSKHSESGFERSKEQYWGNFISYLEKANRVMKPINGDDTIKNQYSKFWPNFGKEMKKAYSEIAIKVRE